MRRALASRRQFLSDVGRSMLVAGIGFSTARDLGVGLAWADDAAAARLSFGAQDRLAALLQETSPDQLLPQVVSLIRSGTELRELVGGAALANARAFGGEDYIGFHTFMALMPSLRMAAALPSERRALPVLKVLYRNSSRLHDSGKCSADTLTPATGEVAQGLPRDMIRDAVHARDAVAAERVLSGLDRDAAWNDLLPTVGESPDVHRIVLAHRAWDMVNLVGIEHATTMLRQSIRYCVKSEEGRARQGQDVAGLLTGLLDQHKLAGRELGTRVLDDAAVLELTATLLKADPDQGAGAIAALIAEGVSAESICEAISLTANELALRDEGRPEKWAQPNKPIGSVHGDSIGVHASDAANAWRHIAQVSNPLNSIASLILSGYHVSRDATMNPDLVDGERRPMADELAKVIATDPATLLLELDGAIREKQQDRVCAVTHKYLDLGHSERAVFDLLLRYATSEDGALHAEKYFWTVNDEYSLMRPAWRNRQIVALARVTSSEYGYPAPGYEEACGLLGVQA